MKQQVKDPVLSLQQLGLLLWCGFNPWPGNFHMPWVQKKKKKKKFPGNLITINNFPKKIIPLWLSFQMC